MKEEKVVEPVPEEPKANLTPDKDGMVSVPKEKLDALLNRLDRLEYAASKGALSVYDSRHKDKSAKYVNLRTFEGLVVLSWSDLVTNNVEKDGNGRWSEDQQIKIQTEDGKEHQMPLFLFTRRYVYVKAEVVSETKNADGTIFKVKVDDGVAVKPYEINAKFVN